MSRIYLYNAHNELWFGINLKTWLYRKPWHPKYKYITEHLFDYQKYVYILCQSQANNYPSNLIYRFKEYAHVKIWALINGYNPFMVKCLFVPEQIRKSDFLLVIFIGNFTLHKGRVESSNTVKHLNRIQGRLILNVNHYPYQADIGAKAIENLKFDFFWAEADLRKNSKFFKIYFSKFNQKFIVTPFAVRDKFLMKRDYSNRNRMAVAVGTMSASMDHDAAYVNHYGHGILQPIRNAIFKNRDLNKKNHIVSYVSDLFEGGHARPVRGERNIITAIANWYHNVFVIGQKNYNKIDMCEIFNSFKLHIVGEEIVGLPGIGFAEGMMCGSVLVGIDDDMYKDYGMIPGVHFIGYTGGYKELIRSIGLVINEDDKLSELSNNSLQFAKNHFNSKAVFLSFVNQLNTTK